MWNTNSSKLADIVEKYVKKGDKLYVEGRIEYRQWQDKEGQTRYSTEINVREMIMLGGGKGGGDFDGESGGGRAVPLRARRRPRRRRVGRTSKTSRARWRTRTTICRLAPSHPRCRLTERGRCRFGPRSSSWAASRAAIRQDSPPVPLR